MGAYGIALLLIGLGLVALAGTARFIHHAARLWPWPFTDASRDQFSATGLLFGLIGASSVVAGVILLIFEALRR